MKRNFNLLVAVLVIAVMAFALASCDAINKNKSHEHEYSADWSHDATNHWHAATCDKGDECLTSTADLAAHTLVEGVCSVCGYTAPECEHSFSIEVTVEPTCTEEGEETYTCTECGYSYTQAITPNDHTPETLEKVTPTCTTAGLTEGSKCSVCNEILKAQVEVGTISHSFENGLCTYGCNTTAPGYEWQEVTYVLIPDDMDEIVYANDGELVSVGTNGFFTIITKNGTKIDYFDGDPDDENGREAKVFDDGFIAYKRLSLNGKVNWKDGVVTKTGMQITVDSAATVKIWWVCGGDPENGVNRYIGIQDVTKTKNDFVAFTEGGVKGECYIDSLDIPAAGSYYIANQVGNNYYAKIEVTTRVLVKEEEKPTQPSLEGAGTYDAPYVLPTTGDYSTGVAGLVFYQYTVPANGYVTLSSSFNGSAWLKLGNDINTANDNMGSGSLKYFALAGTTVYIGVSDYREVAEAVPFNVSFEEVTLGAIDPVVGSWKGDFASMFGSSTVIYSISEDGTGSASVDYGFGADTYEITNTVVIGNDVVIYLVSSYGNPETHNYVYNAEAGTLVGGFGSMNGQLTPYDGELGGDTPDNPSVSYDTVIEVGKNTLYFSAEEIEAGFGFRNVVISEAGNYSFAAAIMFEIFDESGNKLTNNSGVYTLEAGNYTAKASMFSLMGYGADDAIALTLEVITDGGNVGGDDGDDEEYPELVTDDLKESLTGTYKFDGYSVMLYANYTVGQYLANVYLENEDGTYAYDLFFTYTVTANDNGSYSLTLSYFKHGAESGTDYIDTVLGYDIVITPVSE